jgi:hypothetical protein
VPFAFYQGPVTNGTGTIVVLWGFDSVVNPFAAEGINPWLDGLRLLRVVILDNTCTIGTAPQRDYTVGGYTAVGSQFSAVDCPQDQPDTRGWFAALQVDDINFAFYMYMDPLQPAGTQAELDLQEILDSVEFDIDSMRISSEDFQATQQALLTEIPQSTFEAEATEAESE